MENQLEDHVGPCTCNKNLQSNYLDNQGSKATDHIAEVRR